jgi:hypothetical protein
MNKPVVSEEVRILVRGIAVGFGVMAILGLLWNLSQSQVMSGVFAIVSLLGLLLSKKEDDNG